MASEMTAIEYPSGAVRRNFGFQTPLFTPQSLKRFNYRLGIFRFSSGANDGE